MSDTFELAQPFPQATFGGTLRLAGQPGAEALVRAAEAHPGALPDALGRCHGVLLLPGMDAMADDPGLLLRLSRVFGPEVEDYQHTGMAKNMIHPDVTEIFVVSNIPPVSRQPPAMPDPPRTENGKLPTRYPHRCGWHTDQSYRRPPPDVSLFLAVVPVPQGQGQTLFADTVAAYAALPAELKAKVDSLEGLHVSSGAGRKRDAVAAGLTPRALAPHERPQPQPVVRNHPVTGDKALFLCESGQMDWLEGPFVGMEPGPHGDGADLLDTLMSHLTQPEFVYAHEWSRGDLVIWDNRCTLHAATWFDAEREQRVMWRTTVSGNPGAAYAGEARSWLAAS